MKLFESAKIKPLKESHNFPSQFNIDDQVIFYPSAKQAEERCITRDDRYGVVVGVRFSKAKVFYDVLDEYYGEIFEKLDSCFVTPIKTIYLQESQKKKFTESILDKDGKNIWQGYLDQLREAFKTGKLIETIKHEGGKWNVYSKDGKKKLGSHETKKEALDQLSAIEISKHSH